MGFNTKIVDNIKDCARAIQEGEIVAFGTETVYGLGANCYDEKAVAKIFEAKGRPADNPLIVHVSSIEQAKELAYEWTEEMDAIGRAFFPGPFTMVVKKSDKLPDIVSGGLDTVGIRMPGNYKAVKFIEECGVPIAAPSANISGRPSPTTAKAVFNDMEGKIPYILDCGDSLKGIESTVYDVESKTILRPGVVTPEDIAKVVGEVHISDGENSGAPKSPGTKYSHYHPSYKVVLVEGEQPKEKALELFAAADKEGEKYVILDIAGRLGDLGDNGISYKDSLSDCAAALYGLLLKYEGKIDAMYIIGVERKGLGLALMNRLERAAQGNIIKV